MPQFDFRVEGLQKLERDWIRLANDLGPTRARTVANIPLRNALRPVEDEIRANTPVDTGGLSQSIATRARIPTRAEVSQGTLTRDDVAVARTGWFWRGTSLWFQALAIEYGTAQVAPQMVIRDALRNNVREVTDILARELGERIEQRARRLAQTGR